MTITPQYAIGDVLLLKRNGDALQRHELSVLEIETITCPAGTQIHYIGRLWVQESMPWDNENAKPRRVCHDKLWKFREDELEWMPAAEAQTKAS